MADDQKSLEALNKINNSTLITSDGTQSFPMITLQDGSKVQTGTVGALIQNIKLYDRLSAGETIEGPSKEQLEQMLTIPISSLKKFGLFDIFPPKDWIAGKSAGRKFVGEKAMEMGY